MALSPRSRVLMRLLEPGNQALNDALEDPWVKIERQLKSPVIIFQPPFSVFVERD